MMQVLSIALAVASVAGLVLIALQVFFLNRFLRRLPKRPADELPVISILKPLCGLDDGLEQSLTSFAELDYPDYEVLLGFKEATDPAMELARRMQSRWPKRFRVVMQRGHPGLNPKVNQLMTLAAEARGAILVVSDASVRISDDSFLPELAACFEDPSVALVTNPVVGVGESSIASAVDNLYFTSHVTAGQISVKELTGQDIVNGKCMALRRSDLDALGGFESVKDYLAEDYILGRRVKTLPGKRAFVARTRVLSISTHRTVREYISRYVRWAILQHRSVPGPVYAAQILLNPSLLAAAALALAPSLLAFTGFLCVVVAKSALDILQMWKLRPDPYLLRRALLVPLNDVLSGTAWLLGFWRDEVVWRGNRLRVGKETRLQPLLPLHEGVGPLGRYPHAQ